MCYSKVAPVDALEKKMHRFVGGFCDNLRKGPQDKDSVLSNLNDLEGNFNNAMMDMLQGDCEENSPESIPLLAHVRQEVRCRVQNSRGLIVVTQSVELQEPESKPESKPETRPEAEEDWVAWAMQMFIEKMKSLCKLWQGLLAWVKERVSACCSFLRSKVEAVCDLLRSSFHWVAKFFM